MNIEDVTTAQDWAHFLNDRDSVDGTAAWYYEVSKIADAQWANFTDRDDDRYRALWTPDRGWRIAGRIAGDWAPFGPNELDDYAPYTMPDGRDVDDAYPWLVTRAESWKREPITTYMLSDKFDLPVMGTLDRMIEERTPVDDMAAFEGGGVRASEDGKPDFSLLWPKDVPYEEQFLYKLAMHMTRGAEKYAARNWEKFHDAESLERAMRSKSRHHSQDMAGESDEPHNIAEAANCMFVETIRWKLANGWTPDDE